MLRSPTPPGTDGGDATRRSAVGGRPRFPPPPQPRRTRPGRPAERSPAGRAVVGMAGGRSHHDAVQQAVSLDSAGTRCLIMTIVVAEDRDDDAMMMRMNAGLVSGAARRRQQERRGEARNAAVAPARGMVALEPGSFRPAGRVPGATRARDAAPARSTQDGAPRHNNNNRRERKACRLLLPTAGEGRRERTGTGSAQVPGPAGAPPSVRLCRSRARGAPSEPPPGVARGSRGKGPPKTGGICRGRKAEEGAGRRGRAVFHVRGARRRQGGRLPVPPRGARRPRLPRSKKGTPDDFCEALVLPVACVSNRRGNILDAKLSFIDT
jgi:hypothetical protein